MTYSTPSSAALVNPNYYSNEARLLELEDEQAKRDAEANQMLQQEQQKIDQQKAATAAANQKQQAQSAQQAENAAKPQPNVVQELGTAVVGAGIDAVESVGGTAEGLLTGQLLEKEFKPTWLQVADEAEPMNRTVWGNITRGLLEFGLLTAGTGGVGNLFKVSKIAPAVKAGQFLTSTATTKGGAVARGAVKGAMADFTSSFSEGETIGDEIKKVIPWAPVITTDKDDSALERRLKNMLEGIGLGVAIDLALASKAGKKAARAAAKGENVDPQAVAKSTADKLEQERIRPQEDEIRDYATKDPDMVEPNRFAHGDFFDIPDKGVAPTAANVRTGYFENLKQLYDMEIDGSQKYGSRQVLATESRIRNALSGGDPALKKLYRELEREMDRMDWHGENVKGLRYDREKVGNLVAAKYVDLMDAAMDPDDAVRFAQALQNSKDPSMKGTLGDIEYKAVEMLANTQGQYLRDLAAGTLSIAENFDTGILRQRLLTNYEMSLTALHEASYLRGSALEWLKTGKFGKAIASPLKSENIRVYIDRLGKVLDEDPEMAELMMKAFAESGGDPNTLNNLYKYSKDKIFNWSSFIGHENKKSAFVDGLQTTLYNSILSGPKTLARAFTGTNLVVALRPLQVMLGGLSQGDSKLMQLGMHQAMAMFEGAGEAWKLARNTHMSLVRNLDDVPYQVNRIIPPTETQPWKAMGAVIEREGTFAEKAMYRFTSALHDFNNQSWVRYPTNAMAAIDAFSKTIVGRMELKSQAFEKAWNETGGELTSDLVKRYEGEMRELVFNRQGEVINKFAVMAGDEASLMTPLGPRLAAIDRALTQIPMLRPFFLFMKTGVNAMGVVAKHTPLLATFNDEVRHVMSAQPDDLTQVMRYGITSPEKLMEAKALMRGRIATGYMTVAAAGGLYTSGRLTGNGPADTELRNAWIQAGWRPRSIKVGDKFINYDGLEPFASFLALVADIGDNVQNLGESWTENQLQKASFLIAQNVTNKSFLSGLGDLMEVLSLDVNRNQVWVANMINNHVPFASLRNEIANVLNPGMREVEKDIWSTIRNRNPIARGTLPVKRDVLSGETLRDYDFPTRMLNSISPIQITSNDSETRRTLRNTGFDLNYTLSTDRYGNKLNAEQRSIMQSYIGEQNIEKQLAALFKNPQMQEEIKYYQRLRNKGIPGQTPTDPNNTPIKKSLLYNEIERIFDYAKDVAEIKMRNAYPDLVITGQRKQVRANRQQAGALNDVSNLLSNTNK
jgi:hypothetical protein